MRSAVVLAVVLALVGPTVALGAQARKVFVEDSLPSGASISVTIQTRRAAAFRVLLRVPTAGRARLFLTGKHAPKGGALIDTRTSHCDGAAGSFYCKTSYEPLPAGTYTWRVNWVSAQQSGPKLPGHVELTVRW